MAENYLGGDLTAKVVDQYLAELEGPEAAGLEFFKGLWAVQGEIAQSAPAYEAPSETRATELFRSGTPIFEGEPPALTADVVAAAVSAVATYVSENAGLPDGQVDALRSADFSPALTSEMLEAASGDLDAFLQSALVAVGADDEGDLTGSTVAFVLVSALTPLVEAAAKKALNAIDAPELKAAEPSDCPVCGSPASMAFVHARTTLRGGDRELWCGFCHVSWGFPRLKCARCGERGVTQLHYRHFEDDPGHRFHYCDNCSGYIRTVFADEIGKAVVPVVEDIVTGELHAVAEHEGFMPLGDGTPGNQDAPNFSEDVTGIDL